MRITVFEILAHIDIDTTFIRILRPCYRCEPEMALGLCEIPFYFSLTRHTKIHKSEDFQCRQRIERVAKAILSQKLLSNLSIYSVEPSSPRACVRSYQVECSHATRTFKYRYVSTNLILFYYRFDVCLQYSSTFSYP